MSHDESVGLGAILDDMGCFFWSGLEACVASFKRSNRAAPKSRYSRPHCLNGISIWGWLQSETQLLFQRPCLN